MLSSLRGKVRISSALFLCGSTSLCPAFHLLEFVYGELLQLIPELKNVNVAAISFRFLIVCYKAATCTEQMLQQSNSHTIASTASWWSGFWMCAWLYNDKKGKKTESCSIFHPFQTHLSLLTADLAQPDRPLLGTQGFNATFGADFLEIRETKQNKKIC